MCWRSRLIQEFAAIAAEIERYRAELDRRDLELISRYPELQALADAGEHEHDLDEHDLDD